MIPSAAAQGRNLVPGEAQEVVIDPRQAEVPLFRLRVPRRATALRVYTTGATHDVSLYVSQGSPPDPLAGYWDLSGPDTWIDEDLLIDASDTVPLVPGVWYIALTEGLLPETPGGDGLVRCNLHADLIEPARHAIAPDERYDLSLTRATGLRVALDVDMGSAALADAQNLWLEVHCTEANVDVLAGPSAPGRTHAEPYREALSWLGYERMQLARSDITEGLTFHVFAYPEVEFRDELPVQVRLTKEPPIPSLCPPPVLPVPLPPGRFGRAIASTIVVFGPLGAGSGVVVSPRGHVVTNAHVVAGAVPGRSPALVAGFTTDPRSHPRPAFVLDLLEYREDLDLALCRIAGALDGSALPADAIFPYLEPAPMAELALGDEVHELGYPGTGGSGSMVTITLTRGIFSGYVPSSEGLLLKTDAATHAGVSGGACIDTQGRLLGFPSASNPDANMSGGMGYVIPIDVLPAPWRETLAWP